MFDKCLAWTFVFVPFVLILLFSLTGVPNKVSAAPGMETTSNSCLSCHEDLYYLHDTGKYYCVTEHKDRCVNCHDGNPTVFDKNQSHIGLIAHPQENGGEKCRECHAEETQVRLDTFASRGGYATTIKTETYVPSTNQDSGFPDILEEKNISEAWPFWVGGIVVFGLWLALILSSPLKP